MARSACAVLFLLFCFRGMLNAQLPGTDFVCSQSGALITCHLDQPNVKQQRTEYRSVTFKPNDKVLVQAGGCVQTGGRGATWKRYVDPQGPNTDRLYHGLITIPGITGPSLVRIQGIVNQWRQIPASIDPTNSFLVLGYEDDNYTDNGYWGHDDGTGNQCHDPIAGKPAWITIHIDRSGGVVSSPPSAPLDLVWTNTDPNYIPFNPEWGFEKANSGQHPDTAQLCGGFPYLDASNPTNGVGLGSPPCTSQSPTVNAPDGFNGWLCSSHAQPGHLDGHLNWMAATYSGTIQWVDHHDWTHKDDDDYNFLLFPDTATGLTTESLENFGGPAIGLEFDSDETVDLIDKGWWDQFHKAVDQNGGNSGGPPGQMIDGHRAIVIGLLGLDSEHGAYTELHPVWGLAIEVADNSGDDQWAILIRNWGDEGYCSQDSETLPSTTLSFFVPKDFATGVTANTNELYQAHFLPNASYQSSVAVAGQPGGAVLTFNLGPPSANVLISGLVHFAWTVSPAPSRAGRSVGLRSATLARIRPRATTPHPEEGDPGNVARALFASLPAAKQAEANAKLKKPAQATAPNRPVQRVSSIAVVRRAGPPVPQRIPNQRKAALDRLRTKVFCDAYNGHIPKVPDAICAAVR